MTERAARVALDPDRWWESAALRRAAALFDAGDWLEAHEAFEALWRGLPRQSADADLLQGVIQAAVALHKLASGSPAAAIRLAERAATRLRRGGRRLGLEGPALADALARRLRDPEAPPPRLRLSLRRAPRSTPRA